MPVDTPSSDYDENSPKWRRCRDFYRGSDAVKAAGALYLPMTSGQAKDPKKYEAYKNRALVYNATGRTVDGLAGGIWQKAPTIELPSSIESHKDDVTLTGLSADMFGIKATKEVLKVGRFGILIDMASIESSEQRPYWVGYIAEDIISWRTERREGDQILCLVVLRERTEIPKENDPFTMDIVEKFRVLELKDSVYTQTVFYKPEGGNEWLIESTTTPLRRGKTFDFIPFIFLNSTSISPDVEKPPLEDLVHANISHYQLNADLNHGLHLVALPTPYVSGVGTSKDDPLEMGPDKAWVLEKGGSAGMLEFSGAGLGAIREALLDTEKKMATLGARLLEEQPSAPETLGAVSMRHSSDHATLRTVAQVCEHALTLAFQIHGWWVGSEVKVTDVKAQFELNKDFFAVQMSAAEIKDLVLAVQAEKISYETFWFNLARGNRTRPGVTAEQELKQIEAEQEDTSSLDTKPTENEGEITTPGNPWRVEERDGKWVVVKSDTGEVVGTHDSEEAANAHLAALHANVKE